MATGFTQRFQGKIKAGQLWVGSGGVVDSTSGVKGLTDFVLKVPLPVTAAATTDFTVSLPPGGCLFAAQVFTSVAFAGSSTVTIALGVSAGDNTYLTGGTPVSIKALGVVNLTLVQPAAAGPAIMPATSPNLFVRIAQAGTPSATGTAFLLLSYTAQ